MTQPTDGESLNMWETEDGSMSLSLETTVLADRLFDVPLFTDWDFLLRKYDCTVFSAYSYRGDVCSSDSLESIFWLLERLVNVTRCWNFRTAHQLDIISLDPKRL